MTWPINEIEAREVSMPDIVRLTARKSGEAIWPEGPWCAIPVTQRGRGDPLRRRAFGLELADTNRLMATQGGER